MSCPRGCPHHDPRMGSCATRLATLGNAASDSSRSPELCNSSIICWNSADSFALTKISLRGVADLTRIRNLFAVQRGCKQTQYKHIEEFKPNFLGNHAGGKKLSCILDQESRHCPEKPYRNAKTQSLSYPRVRPRAYRINPNKCQ